MITENETKPDCPNCKTAALVGAVANFHRCSQCGWQSTAPRVVTPKTDQHVGWPRHA